VPSFDESLYVGQWSWTLIQPWASAVSSRYGLHLALHALSGLEPPLLGMRFIITLPQIEQEALVFDRDHSYDDNCIAEDGKTICTIDVGLKNEKGNQKFNDFAVLLPSTFDYDSIAFEYTYGMHEWLGTYSQKDGPSVGSVGSIGDFLQNIVENVAVPTTTVLTESFLQAASELPRLTNYRLVLSSVESTSTQFIMAASFTFSNGEETQVIDIYPSSMANTVQASLNLTTAT